MEANFNHIYNVTRLANRKKKKANSSIQLPAPCPADDLPTFREAFPNSDALDDDGVKNLMAAIMTRAAADYFDVCKDPLDLAAVDSMCSRKELERFIDSEWYECLTDIDRNAFRRIINKHRENGKTLPTVYTPRNCDMVQFGSGAHTKTIIGARHGTNGGKTDVIF